MKNQENELNVLLPETSVKIGDKTLSIQPFPFSKLPRVMEIVKNIGNDVFVLLNAITSKDGGQVTAVAAAADVVTVHLEEIKELMAIYCRVDQDIFMSDDFTIEDAIILATIIYTQHKSFFTQKLAPVFKASKTV